jgi:Xaa-Pro aminopeptidase
LPDDSRCAPPRRSPHDAQRLPARILDLPAEQAALELGSRVGSGWEVSTQHGTRRCIGRAGARQVSFLSEEDETPLEPGMTFADEPSIMIMGGFGVRIEDVIVCEESGTRVHQARVRSCEHRRLPVPD